MRNQSKSVREQKPSKGRAPEQLERSVNTNPIKSPSPDRRPANVIANTRSPGLQEIKKQITPIKEEPTALKILQKIEHREKYTPIDTPKQAKDAYVEERQEWYRHPQALQGAAEEENTVLKEESRTKYQSESRTQARHQRSQDIPSEFELRLSSEQRSGGAGRAGELDYLRLLKEKEETIKQLRELLELIERSNSGGQAEQGERVRLLERRLREYSKQVKVLEIENQCLISVIENNHVNLPSNKEEILQREIRELRESLAHAEHDHEELQQARRRIAGLETDNKQLERECDKLLKLMRERENVEKKESAGSSHALVSKDRERVTLSKIKEQYNQNLRLAQENFENQYRDCYEQFRKMVEKESSRIDYYMLRIQDLEQTLHSRHRPAPPNHTASPHQEIESLLLEKYSKYMRELDEEKKVNEKLNMELSIAWKSLRELEMKSFNTSQDILNDSRSEEISELSLRNSALKGRLKELESANIALKRSLEELAALKAREVQELQAKMETIIDVYENRLKASKDEFEALKVESSERESRSRSQETQRERVIEEKITAIIQTFEKESQIYRDSLQSRAAAISSLQEENYFLRAELESCLNFKEKETDISRHSENEKILETMEGELRHARSRLQQSEQRLVVAEEERKYFQRANGELQAELEQVREEAKAKLELVRKENFANAQQLAQRLKELEAVRYENKQLQQNIEEKDDRISSLTQTIIQLEGENQQQLTELQQLRQSNLNLKGESFEEELQSLKQSIVDFFGKYKEQSPGKHLENYYTIEALYEGKIDENVKLHQEVEDLKDFLNREQREKTRLTERITNLEKNVAIYEQELKERRVLYQGLLKEKSRIEKETVLAKRIKDTQSGAAAEKMAGSLGEITGQIDKLVELERTRNSLISRLFVFQ